MKKAYRIPYGILSFAAWWLFLTLTFVSVSYGESAAAQNGQDQEKPVMPVLEKHGLAVFDVDKSGTLSRQERYQMLEMLKKRYAEKQQEWLARQPDDIKTKLDVDGDGTVSQEEFQMRRDVVEARRKEMMAQQIMGHPWLRQNMDKNADGELDAEELKSAERHFRRNRADRDRLEYSKID